MRNIDPSLDRLFRAAVTRRHDQPNDMPFGFDTRVLAPTIFRSLTLGLALLTHQDGILAQFTEWCRKGAD